MTTGGIIGLTLFVVLGSWLVIKIVQDRKKKNAQEETEVKPEPIKEEPKDKVKPEGQVGEDKPKPKRGRPRKKK